MLYWALVFFIVAIIAGFFGFGGVASASAGIAQILFFIFLVLLVVSLIMHLLRGRRGCGGGHRGVLRDPGSETPDVMPQPASHRDQTDDADGRARRASASGSDPANG